MIALLRSGQVDMYSLGNYNRCALTSGGGRAILFDGKLCDNTLVELPAMRRPSLVHKRPHLALKLQDIDES